MSLRDLATMARAKLESEWARAGVIAAAAHTGMLGGKFEPLKFIPPAYHSHADPERKSPEQRASESRLAWRMLDRFFGKTK